jgi:hypothetical protein
MNASVFVDTNPSEDFQHAEDFGVIGVVNSFRTRPAEL